MGGLILWGLMDSPFVRRVAVALRHHGIAFERRGLSVFADFESLRLTNPLGQAPALTVHDGGVLTNTHAILDWLDAESPETTLVPAAHRLGVLRVEAMANALADKSVALNWETIHRPADLHWEEGMERARIQISAAMDWLEPRATPGPMFGGLTRADLALACAARFVKEKHPAHWGTHPNIATHLEACESMPPFAAEPYGT